MALWLLPKVNMRQEHRKCTKMDFWDMWLDSSGAQLSVPHADVEGGQGGEGRRAMGRTIDS
eukprot:10352217-Prorocentrum_lima.AAC.1